MVKYNKVFLSLGLTREVSISLKKCVIFPLQRQAHLDRRIMRQHLRVYVSKRKKWEEERTEIRVWHIH